MPDAGWEGIRNEKVSVGNMMMDGKNNENSKNSCSAVVLEKFQQETRNKIPMLVKNIYKHRHETFWAVDTVGSLYRI